MKKVIIYICVTAFLFGTMEVALKVAGSGMDSLQLTFLRFLIGGVLMLPFGLVEKKHKEIRLSARDLVWLLLVGIMGIPVSMLCFQLGVVRCNAATASSLICLNPLFTMVIAHFFAGERMNRTKAVAFVIGLVATVFMIRPWGIQAGNTIAGMALMLTASVTFAVYTVMGKKTVNRLGTFTQTSLSFIMGSAVLLVIMLFTGRPVTAGVAEHWELVLYIGIFVTGVGYLSYFLAIKYSDASTGSIAFFVKPAIAPVFAVMILHEDLLWNTIVGIVLLITASFITLNRKGTKINDEEEPYRSDVEAVFAHRKPGIVGKRKYCSVFIPLVRKYGEDHLLFEVRSSELDSQPGEICFPGGEMESGESPEDAAVRETMEELGLARSDIKVINQTDTLHGATGLTLYCFIGGLDEKKLDINHDEVSETFTVPLKFFIENDPEMHYVDVIQRPESDFPYSKVETDERYEWKSGRGEVPIYVYEDKVIWGLTARLVLNIVRIMEEVK